MPGLSVPGGPAATRTKSIRLHQVWQPTAGRSPPIYDEEDERPYRQAERAFSADADDTPLQSPAAARVALHPHDPYTGEEIGREEVVKGYEYERGRFVTFTVALANRPGSNGVTKWMTASPHPRRENRA